VCIFNLFRCEMRMIRLLPEPICSLTHIDIGPVSREPGPGLRGAAQYNVDAMCLRVVGQRNTLLRGVDPVSIEFDLRDAARNTAWIVDADLIGRSRIGYRCGPRWPRQGRIRVDTRAGDRPRASVVSGSSPPGDGPEYRVAGLR
jgi:hypothetical protein